MSSEYKLLVGYHHLQLAKRKEAKAKAEEDLKAVEERIRAAGEDDAEEAKAAIAEADKLSKRTVRMDKTHQDEAKHLLRLMGVPVVEAPCEAEAQCAALAKAGVVWAAASEDMDTLCFGAPRLLRRLTFSEARKLPVWQIDLETVLADMELTMGEFVDVCILCGCDYLEPLKGIGPKKALERIRKHGTLEAVVEALRADAKFAVPEAYPIDEAQALFHEADVADPAAVAPSVKWTTPDEAGLIDYLVGQKGFNIDRVRSAIERLKKARNKGSQKRMESFFTSKKPPKATAVATSAGKASIAKANTARRASKPIKVAASAEGITAPSCPPSSSVSDSNAAATGSSEPPKPPVAPAAIFAAASKSASKTATKAASGPRKARAAAVVESDDDDELELELPVAQPVASAFSATSQPAATTAKEAKSFSSISAAAITGPARVPKRLGEDDAGDSTKRDKLAD